MKGLYFQNSQSHFDAAVAKGDIVQVSSDNGGKNPYYAFRTYTVGKEEGKLLEQKACNEAPRGASRGVQEAELGL